MLGKSCLGYLSGHLLENDLFRIAWWSSAREESFRIA